MKRSIRWLLGLVALILVLFGALLWLRHDRADETFAQNERTVADLVEAQRRRGGPRPTLGEPTTDGDAWPIYERAYKALRAIKGRDEEIHDWLLDFRFGQAEPTEVEITQWFDKTRPILEDLRAASRAPTLRADYPYERGMDVLDGYVVAWQSASRVLSLHAKRHVEHDEIYEALDLAVLQAFVGKDFMRETSIIGGLVGAAILDIGVREAGEILEHHAVSPERLERLAAEAEVLRRHLPTLQDAWRVEEIGLRSLLGDTQALDAARQMSGDTLAVGPRFLFSTRLLAADALDQLAPFRKRLEDAAREPSVAAIVANLEHIANDLQDDPNPALRAMAAVYPHMATCYGETQVHLELLRVSVAVVRYRDAHGAWPEDLEDLVPAFLPALPTCPYSGESFRHANGEVWSIGGDGDDDGGRPPVDDGDIEQDGDIVWELSSG